MKFLVYSDPHWCSYSSIVRSRGIKYSTRLENLIKSLNWVEQLSSAVQVDEVICCGDFFDKAELNSEEIAALSEIKWCDKPHTFIAGNHEMGNHQHDFSTALLFNLNLNCTVVTQPTVRLLKDKNVLYLPYSLEKNRVNLSDIGSYFNIIFSHNDIAGIQLGKFVSKDGYSISDLEEHCDLCINGHIHNAEFISKKILNIGNLTGLNFSEDAQRYKHYAAVIDTDNLNIDCITFYENPFAFNFYKFQSINDYYNANINTNSVITVNCNDTDSRIKELEQHLRNNGFIINYKLINKVVAQNKTNTFKLEKTDHITQFIEYCNDIFEPSEILNSELKEITQ